MNEEDYLYGEDIRKRKRQSSGLQMDKVRAEKESRRRRSSSGSDEYDERPAVVRRTSKQEEWKRKSDDFIQSLKAAQDGRGSKIETLSGTTYSYPTPPKPTSYPPYGDAPPSGYGGGNYRAPPPPAERYGRRDESPPSGERRDADWKKGRGEEGDERPAQPKEQKNVVLFDGSRQLLI